jgi:hypothetical protein
MVLSHEMAEKHGRERRIRVEACDSEEWQPRSCNHPYFQTGGLRRHYSTPPGTRHPNSY